MKKELIAIALGFVATFGCGAQTLEKMNWFNEPAQWNIADGKLTMAVTPKSD